MTERTLTGNRRPRPGRVRIRRGSPAGGGPAVPRWTSTGIRPGRGHVALWAVITLATTAALAVAAHLSAGR